MFRIIRIHCLVVRFQSSLMSSHINHSPSISGTNWRDWSDKGFVLTFSFDVITSLERIAGEGRKSLHRYYNSEKVMFLLQSFIKIFILFMAPCWWIKSLKDLNLWELRQKQNRLDEIFLSYKCTFNKESPFYIYNLSSRASYSL